MGILPTIETLLLAGRYLGPFAFVGSVSFPGFLLGGSWDLVKNVII